MPIKNMLYDNISHWVNCETWNIEYFDVDDKMLVQMINFSLFQDNAHAWLKD